VNDDGDILTNKIVTFAKWRINWDQRGNRGCFIGIGENGRERRNCRGKGTAVAASTTTALAAAVVVGIGIFGTVAVLQKLSI